MKIAVAYHPRPRWPKWLWVQQSLERLGHCVRHIRTFGELCETDREVDLVLFEHRVPAQIHQNNICELAPSKKSVWMQWYFDHNITDPVPFEEQPVLRTCGRMMQAMDLVLVKERCHLWRYRDYGIKAAYFDQGCPEGYPRCRIPEHPEWDALVFGTHENRQRREDVRALVKAGFKVAWAGDETGSGIPDGVVRLPWCDPWQLPELMSRAAVSLCVDWTDQIEGYHSDRLWLVLGAGAVAVKRLGKGEVEGPVATYQDEAELVATVRGFATNWHARQATGDAGIEFVERGHTIRHRCEELLKHANGIREQGADAYQELCEVQGEKVREGAREGSALSEVRG